MRREAGAHNGYHSCFLSHICSNLLKETFYEFCAKRQSGNGWDYVTDVGLCRSKVLADDQTINDREKQYYYLKHYVDILSVIYRLARERHDWGGSELRCYQNISSMQLFIGCECGTFREQPIDGVYSLRATHGLVSRPDKTHIILRISYLAHNLM